MAASEDLLFAPNVQRVDGQLSARKIFDTCVRPDGNAYTSAELFDNCNKQINFFGSVVAETIKLHRTYGDLKSAPANESYSDLDTTYPVNNSAENFFHYNEFRLGPPEVSGIDTITSLAPIF